MHLPELALLAGGQGGLAGVGGVLVEGQGVVLEDDAHVLAVLLLDLLDGRADPVAEGALELAELDDGHEGVGLTLDGVVGLDGHLVDGVVIGRRAAGRGRGGLVEALRGQGGVDAAAGGALGDLGLGLLDLLVDDRLEGIEGAGAGDLAAVDEEVGGAARAELGADLHVLVDLGLEAAAVEVGLELLDVQPEVLGVGLEVLTGQGALVLEELVVHLPELALGAGGQGGLGGGHGVLVEGQRVVAEGDGHLVAIGVQDLLRGRQDAGAEGALELAELDDGDQGLLAALHVGLLTDGDLVDDLAGVCGAAIGGRGGLGGLEVLLDAGGVDGVGLDVLQPLDGLQLGVDDLLEGVEGPGAGDLLAVDHEVGGAAGADLGGQGLVGLDHGLDGVALEVGLEGLHVQADGLGVLDELVLLQLALVLEELVVHLPELALLAGGQGGLAGQGGVLVEGQGVVLEDDADLVAVGVHDLLHGRVDPGAEGTLEVAELDDGHGGRRRAALRVAGADRHELAVGGGRGAVGGLAGLGGLGGLGGRAAVLRLVAAEEGQACEEAKQGDLAHHVPSRMVNQLGHLPVGHRPRPRGEPGFIKRDRTGRAGANVGGRLSLGEGAVRGCRGTRAR